MFRLGTMARPHLKNSDQPGILNKVSQQIGELGGNIVEIYHQRLFYDVPLKQREVDIVLETRSSEHIHEIINRLTTAGFKNRRLEDTANKPGD
tara:strand:- start:123 stop:401 length:279 start_codon:yes stop_codon:yes gene_type:complete